MLAMCDHIEFLQYPFDNSLKVLGKKWAAPVLTELCNGRDRFNTLREAVAEINPRTLSARLDDLENAGLVRRETSRSGTHRVHYKLTEKGEDMRSLLRELTCFSLRWYSGNKMS